jgi:hypothetical protein
MVARIPQIESALNFCLIVIFICLWAGQLDDQGSIFWQVLGIFVFNTMSILALGPTQPPIQWVLGALSLGLKHLGCEADHSPPSNIKVKVELYLISPNTSSWCYA